MTESYRRFTCRLHARARYHHAVVVLFNVYRGPVPGTAYLRGTHDPEGRPSREFITRRFPVLMEHTLPSVLRQSTDNLVVVVLYEHTSAMEAELAALRRIANAAAVPIEIAPIAPIDFTTDYRHAFWAPRETEQSAVRRWWSGQEELLVTYLDGDDLLHRDYCRVVQAHEAAPSAQVLCLRRGYLYDSAHERLSPYDRPGRSQPPFFTLRYPAAAWFDGLRWDGGPGRHLHVADHLRADHLPARLWAQHIHGTNDSTRWGGVGPEVRGEARRGLLEALGRG